MTTKIIYFIAGPSPTVDEQKEIDAILTSQSQLSLRTNVAKSMYGESYENCDYVAGRVPVAFKDKPLWFGGGAFASNSNNQYMGVKAPLGQGLGANRPVMVAGDCGASFNELCEVFGLNFSTPVNVTGVVVARANLYAPSAQLTLEFDAETKSMRVKTGATAWPWVVVGDGIFELPFGSGNDVLRVSVINRLLPTVFKSDILTADANRYWRRSEGSWKHQLSFVSLEQLVWTRTQGIGSSQSTDINGHINQIINSGGRIQFMCASGNDRITGSMTTDQSIEQTLANADILLANAIPVVLLTLPPRWGKNATGVDLAFTNEYTAEKQGAIAISNRGYRKGAYSRPGCYVVGFSNCINPLDAKGAVWDGWTMDGKHPAGGLAHGMATQIWRATGAMFAPQLTNVSNIGAGDYYHSINNPGGNLMVGNQGSFAGNVTTGLGAGVTATPLWATATVYAANRYVINAGKLYFTNSGGTSGATAPTHLKGVASDGTVNWEFIQSGCDQGLASNWSAVCTGSGNLRCNVHTFTSSDGKRSQEYILYGATSDGDEVRSSPGAINTSNITLNADIIAWEYGVTLVDNPNDCFGLFSDVQLTGGTPVVWDNRSMMGIRQGIEWKAGRMAVEPMMLSTGCTEIQPRTHIQSKANGNLRIRYTDASVYKVK